MSEKENPIILIADDDPSCLIILTEFLKSTGLQIITATDGVLAFEEAIKNINIHLVIMDIRMPKMDGLEAVRQIKKHRPTLPVIIYTALNDPDYKFLFKKLNCHDFLLKPVPPQLILDTVSKYIQFQTDEYGTGEYYLS
ncbi:MAG: hypothetical protein AMS27_11765 [Bacteroides sp. SM23_62_1]|nr:MAG: hypothetical protein AMS27_11765 [Bacteroides sp. SM23_62_1]